MANGLRLFGMTGTIVAVALAAALYKPEWANDLALEAWAAGPHGPGMDEQLTEYNRKVQRRLETKKQIIHNLIDGRVTLFEAAAAFRRLNDEYPQVPLTSGPGDSAEERLCRQVIEWVRRTVPGRDPAFVERFCEPLEEQLRQHKEQHGKVILPGPVTR